MTTNEELASAVQNGDRDALLKLWEQVRRLVLKQARRWAGVGGLEVDDLMQCGFIALMEATNTYDSDGGSAFSTWLVMHIKKEFAVACGQRTERQRREPLLNALSLDAPLTDDAGDPFTLTDILEDPSATSAMEAVDERDHDDRLRAVIEETIARLTPEQQEAVRRRYYRQEPPLPAGRERLQDNAAHAAALKRLRHPSASKQLRAAME